ncbi:MAG: glycosyltransferase family 4 protein [Planctomycetia bacterium]
MRLGVLHDRYDPRRGGAEAHTDALLRRALAEGDEVVLAVLEGEGPPGSRTLAIEAPRRRPARDRVLATVGERRLREAGCDVVLAVRHVLACDVYLPHGGLVADAVAASDAAHGGAGLLARLARAWGGKQAFFLQAEQALLGARAGPRVVALSRALAARIAQAYPAAAARTVVIPNGVDTERFAREPFAAQGAALRERLGVGRAPLALLVAHRPRLKGLHTVLEAMASPGARAFDPLLHLAVAGRGVERASLALARRLGVAGRLHVLGELDDPRPAYAAADLLVQPTWHDPCSLTTLEALAMSLPVVTTVHNGVSELMGRRGGIAVEAAGDPEALAVALAVLADPALRDFTAEDARYVAERNRLGTRLGQLLDLLRNAAHA